MTRTRVGQRERINFYFDTNVLDALRKLAELKGSTYSELIRVACREYVVREGTKALEDATTIKQVRK